jgi:hypothetical protein
VEEHRWWSLKIIERFVFFFFSFLARCASMPPRRDDSDERRQRFVFLFFEWLSSSTLFASKRKDVKVGPLKSFFSRWSSSERRRA